jgi:hypothetical protein
MNQRFTIELPAESSVEQAKALAAEIKTLDEVNNAGTLTARGVDLGSIGVWVQLVPGIVATVASTVSIIEKVTALIRGKGMQGVKLTLADGTVLHVDKISAEDLKALLKP